MLWEQSPFIRAEHLLNLGESRAEVSDGGQSIPGPGGQRVPRDGLELQWQPNIFEVKQQVLGKGVPRPMGQSLERFGLKVEQLLGRGDKGSDPRALRRNKNIVERHGGDKPCINAPQEFNNISGAR